MVMGDIGKTLNVEDVASRVRYCLAKHTFSIWTELRLNALVVPLRINERTFNAEFLHRHTEEVERTSVDCVRCDEMVASLTDIEYRVEVGSLS